MILRLMSRWVSPISQFAPNYPRPPHHASASMIIAALVLVDIAKGTVDLAIIVRQDIVVPVGIARVIIAQAPIA